MKKYDSYKDSGVEWIGDIPSHWDSSRYRYFYFSNMGVTLLKEDVKEDGIYPVYSATETDVLFGYVDEATIILNEGDIVIPARGNSIGHIKVVTSPSTSTQTTIYSKKISQNIETNFVKYFLQGLREHLFQFDRTAIPQITVNQVKNNPLVIPPKSEQSSIASFLDRKTSEIDDIIADKKRLLELYEEEKTAIINQAVTKGLDPNAPMKDSGIEWLGEIPEHWEIIPLTKYLESIVDYRGRTPKKQNEGLFLVTARNIKKRIIDYSLSEEYVDYEDAQNLLERGRPEIGDVLFTTEAPLGEVANIDRVDIALAQRVIKFRGKKGVLDNYFLKYFLSSDSFQQDLYTYSTGSTAIGIKASKLHHLTCLLPPLNEQQSIVHHIESECSKIDFKKARTEELIELLTEYRTALISEAVTGKIKVTED